MEGVKNPAWQGNRDSFNSAYIFILNDRYPGQAWQARAKAARAGTPGPQRKTSRCYGVQHFREAFFLSMARVNLVSTEMTSRGHGGHRWRRREEEHG